MITFTLIKGKSYLEVKLDEEIPQTMIKVEDTSDDSIVKLCQSWLDAFGLSEKEYRVLVQLH